MVVRLREAMAMCRKLFNACKRRVAIQVLVAVELPLLRGVYPSELQLVRHAYLRLSVLECRATMPNVGHKSIRLRRPWSPVAASRNFIVHVPGSLAVGTFVCLQDVLLELALCLAALRI